MLIEIGLQAPVQEMVPSAIDFSSSEGSQQIVQDCRSKMRSILAEGIET